MQHNDKKTIELIIKTPLGDWTDASFDKTTKVMDVITATLDKFPKLDKQGQYELCKQTDLNEVLEPDRPLVSYGIKDGDVLILTDLGRAV